MNKEYLRHKDFYDWWRVWTLSSTNQNIMEIALAAWQAAQQKIHPTTFWAGIILFLLGFMLGAEYVLYRLGGG